MFPGLVKVDGVPCCNSRSIAMVGLCYVEYSKKLRQLDRYIFKSDRARKAPSAWKRTIRYLLARTGTSQQTHIEAKLTTMQRKRFRLECDYISLPVNKLKLVPDLELEICSVNGHDHSLILTTAQISIVKPRFRDIFAGYERASVNSKSRSDITR